MSQAASHLANSKELQRAERNRFLKTERGRVVAGAQTDNIVSEEYIVSGNLTLLRGMEETYQQIMSLVLTRYSIWIG